MTVSGQVPTVAPLDGLARLGAVANGVDYCFITRRDGALLRMLGRYAADTDVSAFWHVPVRDVLCSLVIESGADLVVPNAQENPRTACFELLPGVRSYLGVPIRGEEGEVIGTACAFHTDVVEWTDSQRENLREIGRQARSAILHYELGIALDSEYAGRFGPAVLAEFVASSRIGMHALAADGRILWANEQAASFVGCSLADYVGRNATEFLVDEGCLGPIVERLQAGETLSNVQYTVRHTDGSVRHLHASTSGYFERGRFIHSRCCLRDITAQVEAADVLRRRERQFRRLADHVPALIWESDGSGERTFFNRTWSDFTGRTSEEECGTGWLAGIHSDDVAACSETFARSHAGRTGFTREYRLRDRAGNSRWVRDSGQPRFDGGETGDFAGFVGCALDVTEIHDAQQERLTIERRLGEAQKLESLALLAGGIAHDFNNLLTSIIGNCGLLRDEPAARGADECVAGIEQAAQRARDLCRRMLAYSGRGRFAVSEMSLSTIVRDHQSVLPMCTGASVSLDYHLGTELPEVSADSSQLGQVLLNLVTNAAEASQPGATVRIATGTCKLDGQELRELRAPDARPGEFVWLEVADAGSGIDAADLSRVFDPFFSTKGPGRGLGLAATIGIVRGHHGAIRVSSEAGRGCVVRVMLPVERARDDVVVVPASRPRPASRQAVLVVDDEAEVREVMRRTLLRDGREVVAVEDGASALAVFCREPDRFGCVVLDYTMPGFSGSKVAAAMREQRPDLPILLVSGYDVADRADTRAVRVDAILSKPFTPSELRAAVAALLLREQSRSAPG
ncbi:MAG: PAS domain S-box protein [bacterium]|nr:PAS domain S-box protein [bacterium]